MRHNKFTKPGKEIGPLMVIFVIAVILTQSGNHHGQISGWIKSVFAERSMQ